MSEDIEVFEDFKSFITKNPGPDDKELQKTFDEFFQGEYVNAGGHDHYQVGENPYVVMGPLTKSREVYLLNYLINKHAPEGNIIEIGSWLGLSTVTIALSLKQRYKINKYKLYAIDPHDERHSKATDSTERYFNGKPNGFDMHDVFLSNLQKWEVLDYVNVIRNFSQKVDTGVFVDISVLWIDGDHSYGATTSDMKKYIPLVKKGGIIVMHDKKLTSVSSAIDDYMKENPDTIGDPDNVFDDPMCAVFKKLV